MSKKKSKDKKKSGNQDHTPKVILITAILNALIAFIDLIKELTE